MASINNLPSEILLEIFDYLSWVDPLKSIDIIRIRRVCRRWRTLGHDIPLRSFGLQVDNVDLRLWKLTRSLLYDNSIAGQIKGIWVRWYRRKADDPRTFTRRWKWTKEDRARIEFQRQALGSYISSATFDAMLEGVNSESIFPFLFYYTTRLESLSLGLMESQLVARIWYKLGSGFSEIRKVLGPGPNDKGFKYLESEGEADNVDNDDSDDTYDPDGDDTDEDEYLQKHMPPEAISEGVLWFHVNMGTPGNYLPGLRNLTNFSNGHNTFNFYLSDVRGWSAKYIGPLMLLPRLKMLDIEGQATVGGEEEQVYHPLSVSLAPYRGLKSTIKSLQLGDGRMKSEDYDAIAGLTGCLEWLHIHHCDFYSKIEVNECPRIQEYFQQRNRATLASDRVFIRTQGYI